jgi:hypothetical protein
MHRFATSVAFLILAVAALPTAALGKGASEAAISGPGLDGPITLAGEGDEHGTLLAAIAEEAGFFSAVFAQTPNPMLEARPAGELGPRFAIEYVMPGPSNEVDTLVQDVYPYASPSPVTYVEPGQPYWTSEQTPGGWYVASPELRALLVSAGLPETTPTADTGHGDSPWTVLGPFGVLLAIGAAAIGAALLTKRQKRPQTA